MSTVGVFTPRSPLDHVHLLAAAADGIEGARLHPVEKGYVDCDTAVVFGVGKRAVPSSHNRGAVIYEHRFRERRPLIIIERGFVHRDRYYGIALNGLNGMGDFRNRNSPPDRWEELGVEIKPWVDRPNGTILVCGQVPWDASVQHQDHVAWCRGVVNFCKEHSPSEVVFRPHPDVADHDYGIEPSTRTFEEDVSGARCVVTFSSTASAMAVLEGVPIFTTDKGSVAWDVGTHDITPELLAEPPRPDRAQWAYNLAYAQWTEGEMREGLPWARFGV